MNDQIAGKEIEIMCPHCGGKGKVPDWDGDGTSIEQETCTVCQGECKIKISDDNPQEKKIK